MNAQAPAAVLCLLLAGPASVADASPDGPLAEYVARRDDSYGWVERRLGDLNGTPYAELTLTSQTWRGIPWKHQLYLIKPPGVDPEKGHALLFILGGDWRAGLEQPAGEEDRLPPSAGLFVMLAARLKAPVAVLAQVPHQPLFDGKREDALIALTFDHYLNTGDAEWPLLLPMVKSAVRAMDAAQEYARQNWSLELKTFTVAGASKRGWTTWLTGAVDPRAIALAPAAIDVLDLTPQMEHQLEAWGEYSEKIHDYTERDLPARLETDAGKALREIVDPYAYRDRLTQPKLIIVGTNDEYWPLDALNLYWDGLRGEKYILYAPNQGHGIEDMPRVMGGLSALHEHVTGGKRLPDLSWRFEEGGGTLSVLIRSDAPPLRVSAWVATSTTRDFRAAVWRQFPARATDGGYGYELAVPAEGHAAMFGEAMYAGRDLPFFLSTGVRIVEGKRGREQAPGPS